MTTLHIIWLKEEWHNFKHGHFKFIFHFYFPSCATLLLFEKLM